MKSQLLGVDLSTQMKQLLCMFAERTAAHVEHLIAEIETRCPQWQAHKDVLPENRAVVNAMLDNPGYTEIGPLCDRLKPFYAMVKGVLKVRAAAVFNMVC